jgi:hypothetical protein
MALIVLAGAVACTKSEPLPVPAELADPVRQLLSTVDSSVAPTFTAETCANLPVDGPTEGARRVRSEATLAGDPQAAVRELRESGIRQGWQPHTVEGAELALRKPMADDAPAMLTAKSDGGRLLVRVSVEYRCSSSGGFDYGRTGAPELVRVQTNALAELKGTAEKSANDIADLFGASVTVADGVAVDCRAESAAGVSKVFSTKGKPISPGKATVEQAVEKIGSVLGGWKVTTKPEAARTVVKATGPGGIEAMIIVAGGSGGPATNVAIQHFSTPCVPVNAS